MSKRKAVNQPRRKSHGPNFMAMLIVAGAAAIVEVDFQPVPVCADSLGINAFLLDATPVVPIPPPPPMPTRVRSETERTAVSQDDLNSKPKESPSDEGQNGTAASSPMLSRGLTGHMALLLNLLMLEKCEHMLEGISDYTATFFKQERIDGTLDEGQVIELKMRHSPFSVYMKWLKGETGRQILYVDGENDNKLLVKFGGWKARLPCLKLDPHGSLAMAESRHPITQAGLLQLVREAIAYREKDLQLEEGVQCSMVPDQEFNETSCYCFTIEYSSPEVSDTYRKSVVILDMQSYLPLAVQNYTWPDLVDSVDESDLDGSTLIEFYSFSNINLTPRLASGAFDRQNKSYRFR